MPPSPVYWISEYAARKGLRYEPDADERWLRVWEPYATLKVPIRYEHTLTATGTSGSISIARFVVSVDSNVGGVSRSVDLGAWIAIAQDERIDAVAAATSDAGHVFGETLDLVPMQRRVTGDAAFDHVFASFAPTSDDLSLVIIPSQRKLTLGWRIPVHFELGKGGFILAPVALSADPNGLAWFVRAVHLFGDKAAKPVK
ncbi:MAG: hypothetical protein JWM74_780 [Myxococcaceae bacterium]|nr:hypothetical protein [Myxococcaceae bacterium]